MKNPIHLLVPTFRTEEVRDEIHGCLEKLEPTNLFQNRITGAEEVVARVREVLSREAR